MRTRTLRTQSLALSLCCAAIIAAGCFRPDVEALTEKLREECRIAPNGPACALENPEGMAYVYERWILEEVDTPEEEACLLAMQCDPNEGQVPVGEIGRCTQENDIPVLDDLGARDPDCLIACAFAQQSCGGDGPCGTDVVDACEAGHDACVDACPLR